MRVLLSLWACLVFRLVLLAQIPVENGTHSLRVLAVSADSQVIVLRLANVGSQIITGIVVRKGDAEIIQEFLPPANPGVVPGATYDLKLGAVAPIAGFQTIRIAAARLADFTGEGDVDSLTDLNDMTRGRWIQQNRIVELFGRITHSPDVEGAVQRGRKEINILPDTLDDGTAARGFVLSGMRDARESASRDLEQLDALLHQGVLPADVNRFLTTISAKHKSRLLFVSGVDHGRTK